MSLRSLGAMALGALAAALAPLLASRDPEPTSPPEVLSQETKPVLRYRVTAQNGIRNRRVTGEVTASVQGIPAAPVDSLCLDGTGVVKVKGNADISVDPIANKGRAVATWTDEHGSWHMTMNLFAHPHHASGVRISPDAFKVDRVILDPVVTNVSMHGNSTAGLPGAPTCFAYLGLWGPADVKLNGQPFLNELDGSFKPQWEGHMMVTAGVRGDDGAIRAFDGSIYDPSKHSSSGRQQHDDIELHVVLSDGRYPEEPGNSPSLYQFFYDIVFEDVRITIDHRHEEGEK